MKFTKIELESLQPRNINNSFCFNSQPFQIDSAPDLTIDFFKDIYTFPPKIKLKFNKLEDFNRFKKVDAVFFNEKNLKSTDSTKLIQSYSNSLQNKKFTSKFYFSQAHKLEELLGAIPIYVVLNGQRELIVSSSWPTLSSGKSTPQDFLFKKVGDVCETSNSGEVSSPSKLGLGFMSRSDAEAYLADIVSRWDSSSSTVGVAIHCVSLSSVYKIMHSVTPDFNFSLVPNIKELDLLLNNYVNKSNIVFDKLQHQVRARIRPLSFTPRINNFYLGDRATPFYKFVSNNEYFKGVPIYIVKVRPNPSNILFTSSLNLISFSDSVVGGILNTIQSVFGVGNNRTFQTSRFDIDKNNTKSEYIFFNYQQANDFSKKYNRSINRFKGGYLLNYFKLGKLVRKPCIYITNLEDFLESNDILTLKSRLSSENVTTSNFNSEYERYFIPDKESVKLFKNAIVKSPVENYKENLLIKYKIFKSTIATLFEF